MGGFHAEICLMFATVQALKDGYNVLCVTDAVGGRSQTAPSTGIERLADAGAVPTTALAWSPSCSGTGPMAAGPVEASHPGHRNAARHVVTRP
jgi:hypothetical protein